MVVENMTSIMKSSFSGASALNYHRHHHYWPKHKHMIIREYTVESCKSGEWHLW